MGTGTETTLMWLSETYPEGTSERVTPSELLEGVTSWAEARGLVAPSKMALATVLKGLGPELVTSGRSGGIGRWYRLGRLRDVGAEPGGLALPSVGARPAGVPVVGTEVPLPVLGEVPMPAIGGEVVDHHGLEDLKESGRKKPDSETQPTTEDPADHGDMAIGSPEPCPGYADLRNPADVRGDTEQAEPETAPAALRARPKAAAVQCEVVASVDNCVEGEAEPEAVGITANRAPGPGIAGEDAPTLPTVAPQPVLTMPAKGWERSGSAPRGHGPGMHRKPLPDGGEMIIIDGWRT